MKIFRPPIIIFQMGKVGSSALLSTLSNNYDGIVVQAHTIEGISPEHRQLIKWRQLFKLPLLVICPVREPLSRNISAFFQNFTRDTGYDLSARDWTVEELQELFLTCYPHNVCLEWFDRHLRTVFGIDVYSKDFSFDMKWKVYSKSGVRLLVYRADLGRTEQLSVISEFIGCRINGWIYSNITADKEYGGIYEKFCASVTLPDIYLNVMCNSSYCRNFWSPDERLAIIKKWQNAN